MVTVALQGDHGKPRPALVVQADHFGDLASVTVLPVTSTLVNAPLLRVPLEPSSEENGFARRSQLMVDKPQTPGRSRLGPVIGRLDDATMVTSTESWPSFSGWRRGDNRLRSEGERVPDLAAEFRGSTNLLEPDRSGHGVGRASSGWSRVAAVRRHGGSVRSGADVDHHHPPVARLRRVGWGRDQ